MIPSGIPWDWNFGDIALSGVPSGMLKNYFSKYLDEPKFEHWTTAKCYTCGKFFRVNGGYLIGGGPSEICPHCGAKGNV